MLYYCNDCNYAQELNNQDIIWGSTKLPEACPNCGSANVCITKDTNYVLVILWWIIIAPPFAALSTALEGTNEFFAFITLIMYIAVGISPKFVKKKICNALLNKIKEQFKNEDYTKAEKLYAGILIIDAYYAPAYIERGKIRLRNKKTDLTSADFTIATLLEPNNLDYFYYRTTLYMEYMDDKALNTAIERFSTLITNGYTKSECFNSRGESYLELGNFDKALSDFEKAIKLEPANAKYMENKQQVLSKMSNNNQNVSSKTLAESSTTNDAVVNLDTCTKDDLLQISVFNEERANKFLADRESGKYYYDIHSLGQELNLQPHEILELENKLIFPLKQSFKTGRTIDF